MTWTGRPDQPQMLAAMTAVSVLPSPVAISAMYPRVIAAAPMICTGNGRLSTVRIDASRATAKARSSSGPNSLPRRASSRSRVTSRPKSAEASF